MALGTGNASGHFDVTIPLLTITDGAPGADSAGVVAFAASGDGAPGSDSASVPVAPSYGVTEIAPGSDAVALPGAQFVLSEGAPGSDDAGRMGWPVSFHFGVETAPVSFHFGVSEPVSFHFGVQTAPVSFHFGVNLPPASFHFGVETAPVSFHFGVAKPVSFHFGVAYPPVSFHFGVTTEVNGGCSLRLSSTQAQLIEPSGVSFVGTCHCTLALDDGRGVPPAGVTISPATFDLSASTLSQALTLTPGSYKGTVRITLTHTETGTSGATALDNPSPVTLVVTAGASGERQWPPGKNIDPDTPDTKFGWKFVSFSGEDASSVLSAFPYRARGFFAVVGKPTFPNHDSIIFTCNAYTTRELVWCTETPCDSDSIGAYRMKTIYHNVATYTDTADGHVERGPWSTDRRHSYFYRAGILAHSPAWNNTDGVTDTQIVHPYGLVIHFRRGDVYLDGVQSAHGVLPSDAPNCFYYSANIVGFSKYSEPDRPFYDRNGYLCPQWPEGDTRFLTGPISIIPVPPGSSHPIAFGKPNGINGQIYLSSWDFLMGNDPDDDYRISQDGGVGYCIGDSIHRSLIRKGKCYVAHRIICNEGNVPPYTHSNPPPRWSSDSTYTLEDWPLPSQTDLLLEMRPDAANDPSVTWGPQGGITIAPNEILMTFGASNGVIYPGANTVEYWNPAHRLNKVFDGPPGQPPGDCSPYMATIVKIRLEQMHLHERGTYSESADYFHDWDGIGINTYEKHLDYWTPSTIYYVYQEIKDPDEGKHPPIGLPPDLTGSGTLCHLRDYTSRLDVWVDGSVSLYDDKDEKSIDVTYDESGFIPCFRRNGVFITGTYLRNKNLYWARSAGHGKKWKFAPAVKIPATPTVPPTFAPSYDFQTSDIQNGRIVALGFRRGDPKMTPPIPGKWLVSVGAPQDDGTYEWSAEIDLQLSKPNGAGCVRTRPDGVMEFVWQDTGGAINVLHGTGIANNGGTKDNWKNTAGTANPKGLYDFISCDLHYGRFVLLCYRLGDTTKVPATPGVWYVVVATPQDDGTYQFSKEVDLKLKNPSGSGCVRTRSDGVLEFVYIGNGTPAGTGGTPPAEPRGQKILHGRGVGNDGGTKDCWVKM